jgi:hypothetical protein
LNKSVLSTGCGLTYDSTAVKLRSAVLISEQNMPFSKQVHDRSNTMISILYGYYVRYSEQQKLPTPLISALRRPKQAPSKFAGASKLALVGAYLLAANYGWGSVTACATKTALSSFGTGTGSGCYETDKTFSNFAVANDTSNGGVAQSTGTVDIAGSDTFSSEKLNTPWTVSEAFTGATVADFQAIGTGRLTTAGTMTMLVNSTNAFLTSPGYPTPRAGAQNFITSVSLSTSGVTGNSTGTPDSLVVIETFCIGNGACTTGTGGDQITLTATYGNNTGTPSYSCSLGTGVTPASAHIVAASCPATASATPITVAFSLNVTTLTVSDNYSMVVHGNNGGNTTVTLNNFTNVFGEEELAPEPSTFALLGAALAGIGVFRWSKRKRRL